ADAELGDLDGAPALPQEVKRKRPAGNRVVEGDLQVDGLPGGQRRQGWGQVGQVPVVFLGLQDQAGAFLAERQGANPQGQGGAAARRQRQVLGAHQAVFPVAAGGALEVDAGAVSEVEALGAVAVHQRAVEAFRLAAELPGAGPAGGAGEGRRGGDKAVAQVAPAVLLGVAFGEGAAPIVAPQAAIGVGEYLPPGAVVPQQGTAGDP